MSSSDSWKLADRPNYYANIDKQFPYSEVPYLGDYALLKIPDSPKDLIPHIDYWGEGKVTSSEGIRGFSYCYNINHQYQLVSAGSDQNRKIPNRIPVLSYDNCDTSGYIISNSVLNVTVAGGQARLTKSCAVDIARIVNKDDGRVVVFGVDADTEEISMLRVELARKGLYMILNANLPRDLQGLTYYDSYVSFVNTRVILDELYNKVVDGRYDAAVSMVKYFQVAAGHLMNETILRLVNSAPRQLMSFSYKLWQSESQDIVRNHFPKSFRDILSLGPVTVVNNRYLQPLKLDSNTNSENERLAWGDNSKVLTSQNVSWQVLPVWNNNRVTFRLHNIQRNYSLKLDSKVEKSGDRQAWGTSNSNEDSHRYYLEPMYKNDTLVFLIINYQYAQGLKLDESASSNGDRALLGHNGSVLREDERFRWTIVAW